MIMPLAKPGHMTLRGSKPYTYPFKVFNRRLLNLLLYSIFLHSDLITAQNDDSNMVNPENARQKHHTAMSPCSQGNLKQDLSLSVR